MEKEEKKEALVEEREEGKRSSMRSKRRIRWKSIRK